MKVKIGVLDMVEYLEIPCRLNVGDILFEDLFSDETQKKLLNDSERPVVVVTHSWFTLLDGELIQCVNTEIE